jgi:hypothetical protein
MKANLVSHRQEVVTGTAWDTGQSHVIAADGNSIDLRLSAGSMTPGASENVQR